MGWALFPPRFFALGADGVRDVQGAIEIVAGGAGWEGGEIVEDCVSEYE